MDQKVRYAAVAAAAGVTVVCSMFLRDYAFDLTAPSRENVETKPQSTRIYVNVPILMCFFLLLLKNRVFFSTAIIVYLFSVIISFSFSSVWFHVLVFRGNRFKPSMRKLSSISLILFRALYYLKCLNYHFIALLFAIMLNFPLQICSEKLFQHFILQYTVQFWVDFTCSAKKQLHSWVMVIFNLDASI